MPLPLKGVRVLDLTNVLAGPLCSYQLAMMGAEVVKIESPGTGDLSRKMGADPELAGRLMGASFCSANAGKKSITLNLKHDEGRKIFLRLVKSADVVLENFRPGVMKRLGLDYERLQTVNPGIIYCAVSGFGQEGPLAQRPAYDQIVQGFSGLMSLTGDQRTAPTRAGYLACDAMGAMTAAFAVAAALLRKHKTGEGEMIDVAMLDSTLATMACWIVSNYLNAGHVPVPMGNENHSAAPSGTFRTGKGLLNIVNNEQHQFEKLCEIIGRPALKRDPRFSARDARVKNREALREILEQALATKTAAEWEALFTEAGVPVGPVLTVPEILAHPQVADRALIKTFDNAPGTGRNVSVPRVGFRLAREQPDVATPPPQLGQDTAAILEELGYGAGDVEKLRREGVT